MTGKEHIDLILNDIEKAEIQNFVANATLVEAVKKVLLKSVYFEGVLKPGENSNATRNAFLAYANDDQKLSNEEIGAKVRAASEAVQSIEMGFGYLDTFKAVPKKTVDKKNSAT